MACRRALLGIVPQCVQPPPTCVKRSTAATVLPPLAARMAAPSPPGPVPITTKSKCSTWYRPLTSVPSQALEAGAATTRRQASGLSDSTIRVPRLVQQCPALFESPDSLSFSACCRESAPGTPADRPPRTYNKPCDKIGAAQAGYFNSRPAAQAERVWLRLGLLRSSTTSATDRISSGSRGAAAACRLRSSRQNVRRRTASDDRVRSGLAPRHFAGGQFDCTAARRSRCAGRSSRINSRR